MLCMNMKTKLLSAFVVVSVITALLGVYANSIIHHIDDNDTNLYEGNTVPIACLANISLKLQLLQERIINAVNKTEPPTTEEIRKIMSFQGDTESLFKKYQLLLSSDAERELFNSLVKNIHDFLDITEQALTFATKSKFAEAKELVLGKGKVSCRAYQAAIEKLVAENIQRAQETSDGNTGFANKATNMLIVVILLAFAVSISLGFVLTNNVCKQLGEDPGYLYQVANEIASGNLAVEFRTNGKLCGVYMVMQNMVQALKDKISEADSKTAEATEMARLAQLATEEANAAKIKAEQAKAQGMVEAATQLEKIVEVLSSASQQLSAQIQQSTSGAELQSQRVTETASAMEEMNATVVEVSKNSAQAADFAGNARTRALEGADIVERAVKSIVAVQKKSLDLKQDMSLLGEKAESIGQILGVISDIADQTNLLALNAAIEAARAGDAGRGFAVVADEVRKLAEKTMVATKEVGDAIGGIQAGTRMNLEHVEKSVVDIDVATQLANQSGTSLQEIVGMVETATDQVRAIATASEEQSAASEEINRSIEDINRISDETATAMAESSRAVSDLAEQIHSLQQLIERMKNTS